MATQWITQMIESYQFSCHFAVSSQKMSLVLSKTKYQNILKQLWNAMKINSSAGFQNVESTRAVILV